MFDYFKKITISNRANDAILYEYVLNEIENGKVIKGLWGKALANSQGNESNAKSIYMKYRVQSIKDILIAREISYNELTSANLFQYLQDKFSPEKPIIVENYKVSEYEESIYNEVANELSSGIRKEGLWLKAIQNTDGDEARALSLYVKYRSEAIKTEKERILRQKRLKAEEITKNKQLQEELEKMKIASYQLKIFLEKNNLRIIKEISETNIIANYNNSPIDAHLKFIDGLWQIVDSTK